MHIFASEPRRLGDQYAVKGGVAHLIAQTIQSCTAQARSAVAIITKNVLLIPFPPLLLTIFTQQI
jgi:hypothetical protein